MNIRDIHKNNIWQKGHNTVCRIDINDSKIEIHNLRCMNHTQGIESYTTTSFHLQDIEQVNLISVPFGFKKIISHLMLEYVLRDGRKYILSIEARRKPGESFSPLKGFKKHYGIIYIWGSYEDLIGLRKNIRKDRVYSYPLTLTRHQVCDSFIFFAKRTNHVSEKSEYYHTLFSNCSTNIWDYFRITFPQLPKYNYYLIFNAKIDVYLRKLGFINTQYKNETEK